MENTNYAIAYFTEQEKVELPTSFLEHTAYSGLEPGEVLDLRGTTLGFDEFRKATDALVYLNKFYRHHVTRKGMFASTNVSALTTMMDYFQIEKGFRRYIYFYLG